ncbi:MAG: T9SS type A sorting domain-containing protein [FCB group bacterium]|jgi:WD40 repeat protein
MKKRSLLIVLFFTFAFLLSANAQPKPQDSDTLWTKKFFDDVGVVKFTPDEKYVVAVCIDVFLYNTNTGELVRTFKGQKEGVSCVDISPDGTKLVSGAGDGSVVLWDLNTGDSIHVFRDLYVIPPPYNYPTLAEITGVAFTNNGNNLIATSFNDSLQNIVIWDLKDYSIIKKLNAPGRVTKLSSSPISNYFSTIQFRSVNPNWDLYLWNDKYESTCLLINNYEIYDCVFSPTNPMLASNGDDASLTIFDINTHQVLKKIYTNPINQIFSVDFSKLSNYIAIGTTSGDYDVSAFIWDNLKDTFTQKFHIVGNVYSIKLSNDNKKILLGKDNLLMLLKTNLSPNGIEDNNVNNSKLYSVIPNPSSGKVSIKLASPGYGIFRIMIYDILGNNIYTNDFEKLESEASFNIDLTGSGTGTYFYKLISPNAVVSTGKFFIY